MSRQHWSYVAYGATAVAALVLLFTLVMIRRIAVAVACIKVSSDCGYVAVWTEQAKPCCICRHAGHGIAPAVITHCVLAVEQQPMVWSV